MNLEGLTQEQIEQVEKLIESFKPKGVPRAMTREEIQKDADNFDLPIERDIYELLADFAELMIKKREKEIVDKIREFKDDLECVCDICWPDGSLLDEAIDIVEGKQ